MNELTETAVTESETEAVIKAFEQQGGTVPWVTPVTTLYADYCQWMRQAGRVSVDLPTFMRGLARRSGCAPCRLPDGTVAMLGIRPRDLNGSGGRTQ